MKRVIALLMISTMLAGCTEVIPDPEDVFSECPSPDWIKVDDEVTWMLDNNSTMPVVDLGNETMLFQLDYFIHCISHLVHLREQHGDLRQHNIRVEDRACEPRWFVCVNWIWNDW